MSNMCLCLFTMTLIPSAVMLLQIPPYSFPAFLNPSSVVQSFRFTRTLKPRRLTHKQANKNDKGLLVFSACRYSWQNLGSTCVGSQLQSTWIKLIHRFVGKAELQTHLGVHLKPCLNWREMMGRAEWK